MIDPARRSIAGRLLFAHEEEKLIFGYTTGDFPSSLLKALFPGRSLLFLKQVHSPLIIAAGEWRPGIEADGLLLDRPGTVAVIQTADCLPLFFFDGERRRGGVLHVGWRGLQQGIEQKLAERLGADFGRFAFFIGPGIEKGCYEVGEELQESFADKPYARYIFSRSRAGKLWLDLKAGLKLSLRCLGAAEESIGDCGLCTRCADGLFPSYRRDGGTGRRIFNFLSLGAPRAGSGLADRR